VNNDEKWINWTQFHSIADEYGVIPKPPDNKAVGFFHAYGINGLEGIEHEPYYETPVVSPKTKRFYGATIRAEQDRNRFGNERNRKYTLQHVTEYSGTEQTADWLSDAMDFMDVTGTTEVHAKPEDSRSTDIEQDDLVKNLYEKRPEFPRVFKNLSRAQFVAETLIKRRDSGVPLTPRRRMQ